MADFVPPQVPGESPPSDAVEIWLTNTVERDYADRGVFPELRRHNARVSQSAGCLHLVTSAQAGALLIDARRRVLNVAAGLKNAYNAQILACERSIQEAVDRHALLSGPSAQCTRESETCEVWLGTKAQLLAKGVRLEGPWPRELNGKRWCLALDWRGRKCTVAPYSLLWSGLLYEVFVDMRKMKQREVPSTPLGATRGATLRHVPTVIDLAERRFASGRHLRLVWSAPG